MSATSDDSSDYGLPKSPPPEQFELTGDLARDFTPPRPAPPIEPLDNEDVKIALAFLKAGAPLQDGTPPDPNVELTKLRRSTK